MMTKQERIDRDLREARHMRDQGRSAEAFLKLEVLVNQLRGRPAPVKRQRKSKL